MVPLKQRLQRLGSVLKEARLVGLMLLGIAIPLVSGVVFAGNVQAGARLAGALWEIGGICIVAKGIRDTQRQFGRDGFARQLAVWFARARDAVLGRPQHQVIHAGSAGLTITPGRPTVRITRNPNRPVEQRLAEIESELDRLLGLIERQDERLETEISVVQKLIAAETSERWKSLASIHQTIEEVAAGGLTLEAIGLVWLILGILSGAFPDKIEQAAKWVIGV